MAIDLSRLRKECVYDADAPLDVILADLTAIHGAVEQWKAYRKKVGWIAAIGFPAGICALIVGFTLVGILLLVAAVFGAIHAATYAKNAVSNLGRADATRDLLQIFKDDSNPKNPISLHLSLKDDRKMVKEGAWSARRSGHQKFLTDSWLNVKTALLDGTEVVQNITDLVRERKFTNPRGKTKNKVRIRHLVAYRFGYPPRTYGDLSGATNGLTKKLKLPPSAHLKAAAIAPGDVKIKVRVDDTKELTRACSMIALGVYRMLNYGRRRAAAQGGSR